MKSKDLIRNPGNWRTHPEAQRDAMRGVLAEIGFAGACIAYETPEGLVLIDGHLRADLTPEQEIPVLVLDVNEKEAGQLLASFDPLSAMAEADQDQLGELLHGMEFDSESAMEMLEKLAADVGVFEADETELPDLESGDKSPFQTLTFTLSDDQAGDLQAAIAAAKGEGPFYDTGNENSNGNALARIVEAYIGSR